MAGRGAKEGNNALNKVNSNLFLSILLFIDIF
jgi:hypothetical protein